MRICTICGQPWDDCCGECQGWITLKQKVEYLKSQERRKENGEINTADRTTRQRKDGGD